MAPNVLSLVALVGTAMAACPLSVSIVDTVDHTATVAITNSGEDTITLFRGNTVLSDHDTLDVVATKPGKKHFLSIQLLSLHM